LFNVSKLEREREKKDLKPEIIRKKSDREFISLITKQVTKVSGNRLSSADDFTV